MVDLTNLKPDQIDEMWAPLMGKLGDAEQRIRQTEATIAKIDAGARGYMAYQRPDYVKALEGHREMLAALEAEQEPFVAEWRKRRGWTRYFLVTNGNGHVHRERNCPTCYPSTQFAWLPTLADHPESEMVAEFGEKACSVCFPTAPSLYAEMKARGELSTSERRTQEEQAAKRAEKDAKAAAKAAKAITNPDGSPLRPKHYIGTVNTLVTARIELTDSIAEVSRLGEMIATAPEGNRLAALRDSYQADADMIAAAIAAKTGESLSAIVAEHAEKARKKRLKSGY